MENQSTLTNAIESTLARVSDGGWVTGEKYKQHVKCLLARLDTCRQKIANLADLYWHDCRAKGERGANYCSFEGTKVCTVCVLADVERERDTSLTQLREWLEEQRRSDALFAEKFVRNRCRCGRGMGPDCVASCCNCPHHDIAEAILTQKQT